MQLPIYQDDCTNSIHKIEDNSVDLGIYDPPFGIGEKSFNKHYKRFSKDIIGG